MTLSNLSRYLLSYFNTTLHQFKAKPVQRITGYDHQTNDNKNVLRNTNAKGTLRLQCLVNIIKRERRGNE